MVIGACVNASLSRESVLFNRDVVHRHGCMSGTRMHFIEVATHLLGGQHGEESESEEEDREEGEAEGQALKCRLEAFDTSSKASSTDPAQVERAIARGAKRIGSNTRGRWRARGPNIPRFSRLSAESGTGGRRNSVPRHRRKQRRWVRASDISPTPSAFCAGRQRATVGPDVAPLHNSDHEAFTNLG